MERMRLATTTQRENIEIKIRERKKNKTNKEARHK
jgi:hypothetical protein